MSDDRQDPRVRELTYRLMEMAPDAPPFPEEAIAMSVPATKKRPPALVWAAAAAAVVLVVGLPLFLFRGGEEPVGPATTIAAPDTTTTTVVDEPTTTVAPSTTAPTVTEFEVEYVVYLFSDDLTTAIGDPALVPVVRNRFVGSEEPTQESAIAGSVFELFAPVEEAGFSTAIPSGLDGQVSVRIDQGVATVDLPREFEAGGGTMLMTARLAQVVFTATQFPDVDGVIFSIDGEIVDVFSGEGIVLDGEPQTRADYVDILPLIFLGEPAIGSIVSSPTTLSGIANVFEATVLYEIVDSSGNVLNSGFTTATCGTGCWGEFAAQAPFFVPEETPGEIVVYEESALDGSRVNEIRYPVTLLPGGEEEPPTTTTTEVPSETTLPGEPTDFWAQEGDVLGVVGVAHDDVLNLRNGPGVGYEVLASLDPLADNLVSTGRNRFIPGAFWSEVEVDGVVGWVNQRYTGFLGLTDDLTSFVVEQMGGIPEAETMLELGTMVAESFRQDEGDFRAVMVIPPTVGDLGEVTFDVVGLLDDAQLGWRLHTFGQPTEGGEGFSLKSVEGTAFCGRGVSDDGLCV